jgi:hypothetical protein
VLLRPRNDPYIEAIATRARAVLSRQPTDCLERAASSLDIPADALQHLIARSDQLIDTSLIIDVVAVLVHECGIDPKWLLTGEYDGALHREALLLGEDRTSHGARVVREFVKEQYRQLRQPKLLSLPSARAALFRRFSR